MRFHEKLPKLRKNNNFSQEQLADKLGVSRQAVSKWEIGSSYPDMDKMLQMCKILNCTLEDLMDDGVLGEGRDRPEKLSANTYMRDFLSFITKSYNMFCSMSLKERVKLVLEMAFIVIVLMVAGNILIALLRSLMMQIVGGVIGGGATWVVINVITGVFRAVFVAIGAMIVLHLYKIRYLNYFVTVEDQNVSERTVEKSVEKEDKYHKEEAREKVIIRDAKHSTGGFFDMLSGVVVVILKGAAIMAAIPFLILFVLVAGGVAGGIFYLQYGVIFLWVTMGFLGAAAIIYVVLEWIYRFVASQKQSVKRIFITGLVGLALAGAGLGLSVVTYLGFDHVEGFSKEEFSTRTIVVEVDDSVTFHYSFHEYQIDNSVDGLHIAVQYIERLETAGVGRHRRHGFTEYYVQRRMTGFIGVYRFVMDDLQNRRARGTGGHTGIIVVTMSEETRERLDENRRRLEAEIQEANRND